MILRLKAIAIICLVFFVCGCGAEVHVKEGVTDLGENPKEFLELFDYEIQNRAFAYNILKNSVENGDSSLQRDFQKAYLQLEELNQGHYSSVANKFGLNLRPHWWTRVRTQLGTMVSAIMPNTTIKWIHQATLEYIPKLERLKRIAPAENKAFFHYVVAQEQVQADAMGLFLNNQHQEAIALFNDFVQTHQSLSSVAGAD